MAQSTAERLRLPIEEVLGDERDEDVLARVRVLRAGGRLTLAARDALLFDLVQHYRKGPRDRWAPVLLDVMAPPLIERLKALTPQPPVVDAEDIAQQFLVEILEAVLTIPIQRGSAFIERRLLLRARTGVVRWLRREARRQSWLVAIDAVTDHRR